MEMQKRKWFERILCVIAVVFGIFLGICLYNGFPIIDVPNPKHVESVTVSAYGPEYGEAANYTKSTPELSDEADIELACSLMDNYLKHEFFTSSGVHMEPKVCVTFRFDDGSVKEVWADNNEFKWNGKVYAIKSLHGGRFVVFAKTLFHLEAQE